MPKPHETTTARKARKLARRRERDAARAERVLVIRNRTFAERLRHAPENGRAVYRMLRRRGASRRRSLVAAWAFARLAIRRRN